MNIEIYINFENNYNVIMYYVVYFSFFFWLNIYMYYLEGELIECINIILILF